MEREGRTEAEPSRLMPNKTDAAFLDDAMHVPLGVIRTREATRQNTRVPIGCDVTLTISVHGSPVLGAFAIARNISGGGICFNSPIELPENAEGTVRCVPESGLEIEARGRIVARDATGDGDFRYRIEFVGVPAELTAAIEIYVYHSWKRKLTETVNGAIGERWEDSTGVEPPVTGAIKE
jgi:hypothetical protein